VTGRDPAARSVHELERVLAEAVTGLWRLADRLGAEPVVDFASTGDVAERLRSARRQLGRILESLADSGIRVEDHRGQRFHPGLAIEVVAYQPIPGQRHETVVEVERPSVYRDAAVIQQARVIVGTPPQEETDTAAAHGNEGR
jgi:hypothetical protein